MQEFADVFKADPQAEVCKSPELSFENRAEKSMFRATMPYPPPLPLISNAQSIYAYMPCLHRRIPGYLQN